MRMISPPDGRPMAGVTPVMLGTVLTGGGVVGRTWKVTVTVLVMLFTVALMVTGPATVEVRVTEATPLVVVLMTARAAVPSKPPAVAENSTAVPFGTGCPFWVAVAVMVTVESMSGVAFE